MKRCFLTFVLLVISIQIVAQHKTKKVKLPAELNEISGLEKFNDTTLIAINDSGNSPTIFFINLQGQIIKKTHVMDTPNIDWEDLTMDDVGNLYIADVGNNNNIRKDLIVLKVNLNSAFMMDSIETEKINFTYKHANNTSFSLKKSAYDCEAIYWFNDSLRLLTKLRSKPAKNEEMNGTFEYALPTSPGNYNLVPNAHYWTGGNNKLKHQVTACDNTDEQLAILTYGFIYFYQLNESTKKSTESLQFLKLTQKEALVYFSAAKIFVAAEKHWLLGGPFLYSIELK